MYLLPSPHALRARQRGVGALAVSLLLLFASSIVVFYLNRGLIFEQKTSANQVRSTLAFEMAEAGIEWATGMLNTTDPVSATCGDLNAAGPSFRRRYIQTGFPGNLGVSSATTTFPGCKVDGTTLTCSCPAVAAATSLGTTVLPGFTVAFTDVAGDPIAVRLTATGCTAQAGACTAANSANSDATATISVILKNVPTLRAAPSSAITCGTSCSLGGSFNVINQEVSSNGYLVNAGTTITDGGGVSLQTIPGQPVENALIADDDSLNALASADPTCSSSAMFQTYFGTTMEDYAASDDVTTIPNCTNPAACGAAIWAAYTNDNARSFYFPDGVELNNSAPFTVLGAAGSDAVRFVSPAGININGNITINGLLFSNSAQFDDLGTGTADVNGALITCAAYQNNGNGTVRYTSANLGGTGLSSGLMVRVPGSWRDF
ncbi:MAG TPA: pilus assembly PilX N-terminal domain-containing protein [Methylibium sp.]|nr:pilus assembly PilX N-terminal domain-containing protein [Methylibium sp.]